MGKYDDISKDAANQTDEELEEGLSKLEGLSEEKLHKLCPDVGDFYKLKDMIAKVKASTNYNARVTAFKDFAKGAGENLLKVAKKAMLPLLCFCLLFGQAFAATVGGFDTTMHELKIIENKIVVEESNPMIDFKKLIKNTRTGFFINQHMDRLIGIYTSIQRFYFNDAKKFEDKTEIANINLGYMKREDVGDKDSPMLSTSARLDSLIRKAWQGRWGRAHVRTANLPTLEFSLYGTLWLEKVDGKLRVDGYYGFGLAFGF